MSDFGLFEGHVCGRWGHGADFYFIKQQRATCVLKIVIEANNGLHCSVSNEDDWSPGGGKVCLVIDRFLSLTNHGRAILLKAIETQALHINQRVWRKRYIFELYLYLPAVSVLWSHISQIHVSAKGYILFCIFVAHCCTEFTPLSAFSVMHLKRILFKIYLWYFS